MIYHLLAKDILEMPEHRSTKNIIFACMRRSNTQLISDVLKEFLQENTAVAGKLAETRVIQSWSGLLGEATMKYTTSIYIRNKVLYVRLSSAVLRNELSMCRERLIARLNEEAGENVIQEIVFS